MRFFSILAHSLPSANSLRNYDVQTHKYNNPYDVGMNMVCRKSVIENKI